MGQAVTDKEVRGWVNLGEMEAPVARAATVAAGRVEMVAMEVVVEEMVEVARK